MLEIGTMLTCPIERLVEPPVCTLSVRYNGSQVHNIPQTEYGINTWQLDAAPGAHLGSTQACSKNSKFGPSCLCARLVQHTKLMQIQLQITIWYEPNYDTPNENYNSYNVH